MDYSSLIEVYNSLASTAKRLEKTDIISEFIKKVPKDELKYLIYLLQGKVFPAWDERKIGVSSQLTQKALSSSLGFSLQKVESLWKTTGDLGKVAEKLVSEKKQSTLFSKKLTVKKVIENIKKLSQLQGQGAVSRKISLISELITSSTPEEAKYVVKTILEELRIGVASGILRDSISHAFSQDVKEVEKAFDLTLDYGEVAELAKENKLHHVQLLPLRPVRSMLAILVKDVDEAFEALGKPSQFEFKLDGFRVQIHKKGNEIKLFTRNFEDVTKQFPDIVQYAKENVSGSSFILDSEVVGYDKKTQKHIPFQKVSQRIKRKYNIEGMAKKFPMELNIFDVLFHNNKTCLDLPLKERREILEKLIKSKKGKILITEKLVTSDVKKADDFFKSSLKLGNEGLMIKNLNSVYRSGRYVSGWCKLKSSLEPLDLVVVGAEYGEGKRAGLLSSYVVACKSGNKFLECGMVSTGVKEKDKEGTSYSEMTRLIKPLIEKEQGRTVYIKPKIVIEVGYEEIQKSPTYSSGFALRFPRFKSLRSDKDSKDANTIGDLNRIYKVQRGKTNR